MFQQLKRKVTAKKKVEYLAKRSNGTIHYDFFSRQSYPQRRQVYLPMTREPFNANSLAEMYVRGHRTIPFRKGPLGFKDLELILRHTNAATSTKNLLRKNMMHALYSQWEKQQRQAKQPDLGPNPRTSYSGNNAIRAKGTRNTNLSSLLSKQSFSVSSKNSTKSRKL